jgi:hypothetical protein
MKIMPADGGLQLREQARSGPMSGPVHLSGCAAARPFLIGALNG